MGSKNSTLVYSTDGGRVKAQPCQQSAPRGDGIIRIRRETKGRKGKGVTTVDGFDLDTDGLKKLAKTLKQKCSTGGTVKDGVIEIQGDHRDTLKNELQRQGFSVKLAGG